MPTRSCRRRRARRRRSTTYIYHDLTVRWNINDTLGLTAGALNIADKDPPVYTTSSGVGIQANTDPSTYDVLGRRYFVNLTAKF